MSPISFATLSGAGIVKGHKAEDASKHPIYVHATYDMVVEQSQDSKLVAKLTNEDRNGATLVVTREAPIYPVTLDSAGAQSQYLSAVTEEEVFTVQPGGTLQKATLGANGEVGDKGETLAFVLGKDTPGDQNQDKAVKVGDTVRIDCYEVHYDEAYEMSIEASNFAGYYYIEASTLFRDEATGVDLPAEFVIPRGKIQSNFTFSMANSGDPSEQMFQSEYRMAA